MITPTSRSGGLKALRMQQDNTRLPDLFALTAFYLAYNGRVLQWPFKVEDILEL